MKLKFFLSYFKNCPQYCKMKYLITFYFLLLNLFFCFTITKSVTEIPVELLLEQSDQNLTNNLLPVLISELETRDKQINYLNSLKYLSSKLNNLLTENVILEIIERSERLKYPETMIDVDLDEEQDDPNCCASFLDCYASCCLKLWLKILKYTGHDFFGKNS